MALDNFEHCTRLQSIVGFLTLLADARTADQRAFGARTALGLHIRGCRKRPLRLCFRRSTALHLDPASNNGSLDVSLSLCKS